MPDSARASLPGIGQKNGWVEYARERAIAIAIVTVALVVLLPQVGAVREQLAQPATVWRVPLLSWSAVFVTAALRHAVRVRGEPPGPGRGGYAAWVAVIASLLGSAVLTATAPWRLVTHAVGFVSVAVPIVWLAQGARGPRAALDAALAISLVALVPAALDTPRPPHTREFEAASPYRWSAGFPSSEWRIRHVIRSGRPVRAEPLELLVWLAREQSGSARLVAWLNGHELGELQEEELDLRVAPIPPQLVAGQEVLSIELAARGADPSLRVLAHPWAGGATAGGGASAYFDGARWWPGTFNDLERRPRAGIYVITLRGLWR